MLTLIVVIAGIFWIINRFGELAGGFAVLGVIGVFILYVIRAAKDEATAHYNFVQYWKNRGPAK